MKAILGRMGLATTKYATAAVLLSTVMSVGGRAMITRDIPVPAEGDGGNHVGNYCHDETSIIANRKGGELDRDHGTKTRATGATDPRVVQ